MTAHGDCSFCNSENLQQAIQMQLSKKHYYFSQFFAKFLKLASSLQYFEEKNDPPSLYIPEIINCERRG